MTALEKFVPACREFPLTILDGQSASDIVDVTGFTHFALAVPAGFTGDSIRICGTLDDDEVVLDVVDENGDKAVVPVVAGSIVGISALAQTIRALRNISIVSEAAGVAAVQTDDVVVTLIAKAK